MNRIIRYWLKTNYHLDKYAAKVMVGVQDLESTVQQLRQQGIPINQEIRHDLGETEKRYWLSDEYREANR